MELRELAMQAASIAQDAGKHALNDQITPKDLGALDIGSRDYSRGLDVDHRLAQFIYNRLTYVDGFQGRWEDRPEHGAPGSRYWCIGGIDGVINYSRNMAEWAVTISLFEFNEHGSAQPIIGIVHVPALALTYLAARGQGAIRIRRTPLGEKREKIMPSTTTKLDGSVVAFGMSFKPEDAQQALDVVYRLAG
ncbi:inositol monophosphatase family protein, partial [Bifidobacterium cuniculi]